jgi:hypothetical protein
VAYFASPRLPAPDLVAYPAANWRNHRAMDLFLRKENHPQASDDYRVVVRDSGDEIEVGSIGSARSRAILARASSSSTAATAPRSSGRMRISQSLRRPDFAQVKSSCARQRSPTPLIWQLRRGPEQQVAS